MFKDDKYHTIYAKTLVVLHEIFYFLPVSTFEAPLQPVFLHFPSPRYWSTDLFRLSDHMRNLSQSSPEEIDLHIRLPFCESICHLCESKRYITTAHEFEKEYVSTLLQEWQLYLASLPSKPVVRKIHLSGGTPSFFSVVHLELLMRGLLSSCRRTETCEMIFDAHGLNTQKAHLKLLYLLGFRTLQLKIQSFDSTLQSQLNEKQTFHQLAKITIWAKEVGFTTITHQISLGRPYQDALIVGDMIEKSCALQPDYIQLDAFRWNENLFSLEENSELLAALPSTHSVQNLFETAHEKLAALGYFSQHKNKRVWTFLQHNTASLPLKTTDVLGLGAGAQSTIAGGKTQNESNLKTYLHLVQDQILPVAKGHCLVHKDDILAQVYEKARCEGMVDLQLLLNNSTNPQEVLEVIASYEANRFLSTHENGVEIKESNSWVLHSLFQEIEAVYYKEVACESVQNF